jgi:hypothetical protein
MFFKKILKIKGFQSILEKSDLLIWKIEKKLIYLFSSGFKKVYCNLFLILH